MRSSRGWLAFRQAANRIVFTFVVLYALERDIAKTPTERKTVGTYLRGRQSSRKPLHSRGVPPGTDKQETNPGEEGSDSSESLHRNIGVDANDGMDKYGMWLGEFKPYTGKWYHNMRIKTKLARKLAQGKPPPGTREHDELRLILYGPTAFNEDEQFSMNASQARAFERKKDLFIDRAMNYEGPGLKHLEDMENEILEELQQSRKGGLPNKWQDSGHGKATHYMPAHSAGRRGFGHLQYYNTTSSLRRKVKSGLGFRHETGSQLSGNLVGEYENDDEDIGPHDDRELLGMVPGEEKIRNFLRKSARRKLRENAMKLAGNDPGQENAMREMVRGYVSGLQSARTNNGDLNPFLRRPNVFPSKEERFVGNDGGEGLDDEEERKPSSGARAFFQWAADAKRRYGAMAEKVKEQLPEVLRTGLPPSVLRNLDAERSAQRKADFGDIVKNEWQRHIKKRREQRKLKTANKPEGLDGDFDFLKKEAERYDHFKQQREEGQPKDEANFDGAHENAKGNVVQELLIPEAKYGGFPSHMDDLSSEFSKDGKQKKKDPFGVEWDAVVSKWRAIARVDGKRRLIGEFDEYEDAKKAVERFENPVIPALNFKPRYHYLVNPPPWQREKMEKLKQEGLDALSELTINRIGKLDKENREDSLARESRQLRSIDESKRGETEDTSEPFESDTELARQKVFLKRKLQREVPDIE